jgi:hypothetical protein
MVGKVGKRDLSFDRKISRYKNYKLLKIAINSRNGIAEPSKKTTFASL